MFEIAENNNMKIFKSEDYNYIFSKNNGMFMRWGKTLKDDPIMCKFGPEIADIEISTICNGPFGTPCSWCYKSNTGKGENMSLKLFEECIETINSNNTLTQVALGIGDIQANPDLWAIMEYCRSKGIVPNITINGKATEEEFDKLAALCGAVAVSNYGDDICFNAVKELTDRGLKQVNIHQILADETLEDCMALIDKRKTDPRLEKLNAIVFLTLKPKGNRNTMHKLSNKEKYKMLMAKCEDRGVTVGFDSCGALPYFEYSRGTKNEEMVKLFAEPCESTLFSIYINTKGFSFPCSFTEGLKDYPGVFVPTAEAVEDVWYNPQFKLFRERLLKTECGNEFKCRTCPHFDIYPTN